LTDSAIAPSQSTRTFVCIELPAEVRAELGRFQALLPALRALRPVRPDMIHLTLRFLGNLSTAQVERVEVAAAAAAAVTAPFSMSVNGIGAFPSTRRPRVIWAGITEGGTRLESLHERFEGELKSRGFAGEDKPFAPHLTLARVRPEASSGDLTGVREVLAATGSSPSGARFEALGVTVMKSELRPNGSVHTPISRHAFS
jgi:RNA 2',3'-cyclic 3'-phosphodiesterase